MLARIAPVLLVTSALAACGSSTGIGSTASSDQNSAAPPAIANACFALNGLAPLTFFWKPSGLGTYLPYDANGKVLAAHDDGKVARDAEPGPQSEWSVREDSPGAFRIVSTSTSRALAVSPSGELVQADDGGKSFTLVEATGCRAFPESEVNAIGEPHSGTNPDGTVFGFADLHLHITAELRAGGKTIYGEPFDRFGIGEALGRDADVHGPDGALDVTGNLLRGGSPVGTHDTHGWPTFAGWPVFDTNTHQQIYYRWLERAWMAGQRLVVAQTVEDQPICEIEPQHSHSCDETETVQLEVEQLRAMQDYVDAQSGGAGRGWFRLVYDPREARRVIEQGKLAVVIGVESSNLFGCSEFLDQPQCTQADVDRGIALYRSLGVTSVFPAHWVDNAFAGAALEGGDKGAFISSFEVLQTGHPFRTGACPDPSQGEELVVPGKKCNVKGLTALGEYLIERLIDAHMLIETDHMSEWARERVIELAEANHYPLVSSHTNTGGLWTDAELNRLYALGGIGSARIDMAPGLATTIQSLQPHRDARFFFGVPLGSDTGGFASLPGPRTDAAPLIYPFASYDGDVVFDRQVSGERTFDLNDDGVAHYGLVADLVADLQRTDPSAADALFHSAEAYLQMWQRAFDH